MAAATAAVFCIFATRASIGTADAFAAFFLLSPDIKSGKADHKSDYYYKNKVFHKTVPFKFLFCGSLFCGGAKINNNSRHCKNRNKTRNKCRTKSAGGDKSSDLIYKKAYAETNRKLKPDSAQKPFCAFHFSIHGADCCKTRRSEKVEHKICKSGGFCDCLRKFLQAFQVLRC